METSGTISAILQQKSAHLWTISPDATVYEAISLMAERNIGAVLVTQGGELLGVLSERDYTRNVVLKGRSSRQTAVRDIIAMPALFVSPNETVAECMRIMTARRVRHLPVLEESKIVGVVSIGDLVNWIISSQKVALDQMEDYIAGKYPG